MRLEARNLTVSLGARRVVEGVSLAIEPGLLTVLVGPNGAGKTTLVRALAGLLPGAVYADDRPLSDYVPAQRARLIGYLPQGHEMHWPIRVRAAVELGRLPFADRFRRSTADDRAAVDAALERLDLTALTDRPVTALSGGERARVALARALATGAPVLIADEPTSALDPRHRIGVMDTLRRLAGEGTAVLAVLHDLTLAARMADRVALMVDGRLAAFGPPADVLTQDRLKEAFGITTRLVETETGPVPVPWGLS
jgi:iron complex transport system ATP-binding protein